MLSPAHTDTHTVKTKKTKTSAIWSPSQAFKPPSTFGDFFPSPLPLTRCRILPGPMYVYTSLFSRHSSPARVSTTSHCSTRSQENYFKRVAYALFYRSHRLLHSTWELGRGFQRSRQSYEIIGRYCATVVTRRV